MKFNVYVERSCSFVFPVEAEDRKGAWEEAKELRRKGLLVDAVVKRGRALGGFRLSISRVQLMHEDGSKEEER